MSPTTTRHYRACNLCEAICGITIDVDDSGAVTSIRGDDDDPFSQGHICPKAVALQDLHDDPDRLRRPMRKLADGSWQEMPWDAALDLAAARLLEVQAQHGKDSLAAYIGNPAVHNYGMLLYGPPLLKALGSRRRYSATSVDQLPHHLAAYLMFGHMLLLPIPDIDRTQFMLVLGANPVVSNGSLMTAPGMKRRLKALRERGGRLVVVDPRRTETARMADEHLFIRPGGDALLLLAMVQVLFADTQASFGRLAHFTDGIDELRRVAEGFTPELVAAHVGIEAATIRRLAHQLAAAERGVVYGRMGTSTQEHGSLCQWLITALNIITGNLDRVGGAMFTKPAVDIVASRRGGSFGRWHSRVRGLPEFGGELPVSTLAEDILAEDIQADDPLEHDGNGSRQGEAFKKPTAIDAPIKALLTAAGNPVLSTPGGQHLERAFGRLDFMLSIDFYLNETTCHADLILPPTGPLEHDHYDLVFNALAVRDTARYSPPVFEPAPDAMHDWQILLALEQRVQPKAPLRNAVERRVRATAGPRGLLAMALRMGPHGAGINQAGSGLTLKRLEAAQHGVDLGALEPCLPKRLRTSSGHIDLAPRLFLDAADDLRAALETPSPAEPTELMLIGRRQVRSNNSWLHNAPRLMRGKDRCTLLMHPDDAMRLELDDGQRIAVSSSVGEINVPVEISDEMMPGVVSLPHGWGHGRDGVQLATAGEHPGASVNDLTDPSRIDALSGNAAFSGLPVTVCAAEFAVDDAAEVAAEVAADERALASAAVDGA